MSRTSTNPPFGQVSSLGRDSINRMVRVVNTPDAAEGNSDAAQGGRKSRDVDDTAQVTDLLRRESHDELRAAVVTDDSTAASRDYVGERQTPRRVHPRDRAHARRRLHVISFAIGMAVGLTIAAAVQAARQEIAQFWPVVGGADTRIETDPTAIEKPVARIVTAPTAMATPVAGIMQAMSQPARADVSSTFQPAESMAVSPPSPQYRPTNALSRRPAHRFAIPRRSRRLRAIHPIASMDNPAATRPRERLDIDAQEIE